VLQGRAFGGDAFRVLGRYDVRVQVSGRVLENISRGVIQPQDSPVRVADEAGTLTR
jgi:hypothetical protein